MQCVTSRKPPPNVISKASEQNIPILLVNSDTYEVARQMDNDNMQPLLTKDDTEKIDLLAQLVKEYIDLSTL